MPVSFTPVACGGRQVSLRAYGVSLSVRVSEPALEPGVAALLPPGHVSADPREAAARFSLERHESLDTFRVLEDDETVVAGVDLAAALDALDGSIRLFIAANAPEFVFVHAGVVADRGRGLVLPGATQTGKTELVAALVRAGATYYSDEFAVLDAEGRVHPYAKPLARRAPGGRRAVSAEDLGGTAGAVPVPVALIAATPYEPEALSHPRRVSRANGALLLLAHAGQARRDPERVWSAVLRASEDALVVEGPRGDAAAAAETLLGLLRSDRSG